MLKCHNSLPDSDISVSQMFVNIRNWKINHLEPEFYI